MPLKRQPREIFLSHSSRDQRLADSIVAGLRNRGFNVWYAPIHIEGAQEWHDEIGKALRRCDAFVVLLTPSAVRSPWVKHEFVFAISKRQYHGRIVPVLLKKCKPEQLSWVLQNIQQIDCVSKPGEAHVRIAELWK